MKLDELHFNFGIYTTGSKNGEFFEIPESFGKFTSFDYNLND